MLWTHSTRAGPHPFQTLRSLPSKACLEALEALLAEEDNKHLTMAAAVLAADVWAQCDRDECQKWRRLPPGTVIDEESKWYLLSARSPCPPFPRS